MDWLKVAMRRCRAASTFIGVLRLESVFEQKSLRVTVIVLTSYRTGRAFVALV